MRKNKLLFSLIFTALTTGAVLTACSSINNPFNPRAELRVMDVKSTIDGRFVGIRQSIETEGNTSVVVYSYSEPVVTLETLEGYPAVNFNRFTANINLADGTVLPQKTYPLTKGTIQGEQFTIQFPILSADRDLQSVVYPGNNAPRVRDGHADIVLFGKDLNGNDIQVPLSVPLSFESTAFSDSITPPTAAPSPSASPSALNSSATPGGQ